MPNFGPRKEAAIMLIQEIGNETLQPEQHADRDYTDESLIQLFEELKRKDIFNVELGTRDSNGMHYRGIRLTIKGEKIFLGEHSLL